MYRIILTFTLLGLFINHSLGQIGDEIKSYVDSTEIMVDNGRKLMIKELRAGNLSKVEEIYNYLSDITYDDPNSAFMYTEDLCINMLLNDWEHVQSLMENYIMHRQKSTYPVTHELMSTIFELFTKGTDQLLIGSRNSSIDDEAKRIIELLLNYMDSNYSKEDYNQVLKSYNKEYKVSNYEPFVEDFLPKKHIKGSWSYSFGSGMFFTTDKLAENFTGGVSYNMAMDVNVQHLYASLYMYGADPKVKIPFSAVTDAGTLNFELDESFLYLDIGIKAGYFLITNNRIQLAPYVSTSGSYLKSNQFDDPEDNDLEYDVFNSFTYGAGIHSEIKITEFNNLYPNYYGLNSSGYLSIKLETGYSRILKFNKPGVSGDTPYILCALVFGFGEF